MLTKIDSAIKYGRQHGGFGIEILYPGLIRPALNDTGFYTIGRIDHARITPGTLIPMHPHRDDEILTYLRTGKVRHLDSEGYTDTISSQKWMMMNAGANFFHEEKVLEEGGILEGLQIFIRPESSGLQPRVQFHELQDAFSLGQWRKIAGNGKDYPLQIRSNAWIMDMRLQEGNEVHLPEMPVGDAVFLFYVFSGKIQVNAGMLLAGGESVLVENDNPVFYASGTADIILFVTQTSAVHFDGGMYSGNLQTVI